VKRRQKKGFLDFLLKEYEQDTRYVQKKGNRLRKTLERWLIEEQLLSKPPQESDTVSPDEIVATIGERICAVSGHVWIEFVEGANSDSIRGPANSRRDEINSYVAEFLPVINPDLMFDVLDSAGGGRILWRDITANHVVRLFTPLFKEARVDKRKQVCLPARDPLGAVPGKLKLFTPGQHREQGSSWLQDRRDAYITSVWPVNMPRAMIQSISEERAGWRYSFTPEHYSDSDNCVTLACYVLDRLVSQRWLKIVQRQCKIDLSKAHKGVCKDCHVKEQGRMSCTAERARQADEKRRAGLKRCSIFRVVK
jgi:hypothetical protein